MAKPPCYHETDCIERREALSKVYAGSVVFLQHAFILEAAFKPRRARKNASLPLDNIFVIVGNMNTAHYLIRYYNESVQSDIFALPETLQARYVSLTDRMVVFGANLGEPHTKAMSNGLFELRIKGAEGVARVFYCTLTGKRIVMLHSFIKKTPKTPPKELKLATQRMKEIRNAHA